VSTDADTFGYRRRGDPSRDLILFLHGFLGGSDEFDALTAALSDTYCCLSVDLPGHGATRIANGPPGSRMAQTAQALTQLLETLDVTRAAVVGYSMGGRLALYLAVQSPPWLTHVALISASPGLATAAERRARAAQDEQLARSLETEGLAHFLARWYDQPLFATLKAHASFPHVLARRRRNDPAALAQSLRQLGTGQQPSLWPHLASLSIPALLLCGARDEKYVAINGAMTAQCPTAELQTIPDCGHAVHLEAPTIVAERLRGFLSGAAPSTAAAARAAGGQR
jgi:2-succinyl-6-hydroxy-2,4-cyclohexadiene-1-carboxylate synthase